MCKNRNKKLREPVFIIGGSRTGSELLRGILEKYSEISFVNEMHLLAPKWLRKDFAQVVKEAGGLNQNTKFQKIKNLISLNRFDGYYWKVFFEKVDVVFFEKIFCRMEKSIKSILECALIEQTQRTKKAIRGAKFPVHYSFTNKLIDWFPAASLIHTVRDPRAVYYSQSRKYLKTDDTNIVRTIKIFKQFTHIVIQANWTAFIHLKYRSKKEYFCIKYESLVKKPEIALKELVRFLEIPYKEEMRAPKVYSNSSFKNERGQAKLLNVKSVDKWKSGLSTFEGLTITLFTIPAQIIFNYKIW